VLSLHKRLLLPSNQSSRLILLLSPSLPKIFAKVLISYPSAPLLAHSHVYHCWLLIIALLSLLTLTIILP
jgi:hypothetical protein